MDDVGAKTSAGLVAEACCVLEDGLWQRIQGIAAAVALNLCRCHRLLNPHRRCHRLSAPEDPPGHPAPRVLEKTLRGRRKEQNPESSGQPSSNDPSTDSGHVYRRTAQPFNRPIQSNSTLLYTWPIDDP